MTVARLARAIENVRHKGLMKRPDDKQPMVPKTVTPEGRDWKPCDICYKEAREVLIELNSE